MPSRESRVHLVVGSRYENIDLVQVVVEESLKQLDLDEDTSHWVGMAVREAVANAIKHGNLEDPDKKVEIDFGLEGDEVIIEVQDEGKGFDLAELSDPRAEENLLRPHGRGVFYMKSFMDEVDYTFLPAGGTIVTLRKRLEKGGRQAASEVRDAREH